MSDSLTTNLKLELEKTNKQFERFIEQKITNLKQQTQQYEDAMEECECTIQALRETGHQLEQSRDVNNMIKEQQQNEINALITFNENLKLQLMNLQNEYQFYQDNEEKIKEEIQKFQEIAKAKKQKIEQKLQDFTYGVQFYYNSLGLEFQKAQNDYMKFIFHKVYSHQPDRRCHFVLFVDENNQYQLIETSPKLPDDIVFEYLRDVNDDNNLGKFIFRLRKEFVSHSQTSF